MNSQAFLEVSRAADLGTLERRLISFAYSMDFDLVNVLHVTHNPGHKPKFLTVGNVPRAFAEASRSDADAARDPVLNRLHRDSIPFIYDQTTYVDGDAADLWEEQASFGYCTGISCSLHLRNGSTFMMGLDRNRPLPAEDSQITRMLADLQLLAVHAQHAVSRLAVPLVLPQDVPQLTRREIAVLALAREGLRSAEMADRMRVSESTVNFHIANATRKLGSSNRIGAVNRAIDLGLL